MVVNTLEDRFWAKVRKTESCWIWTASTSNGYGRINPGGGHHGKSFLYAHRVSLEIASGKAIPAGLFVDHICHNRACVNPDHLRLVTAKQNVENQRGVGSDNRSGYLGVSWFKPKRKWRARVCHNRREYHVGYFDDPAEAGIAAAAMRNELFTHNDADRKAA